MDKKLKILVLVVEDEEVLLSLIEKKLEKENFEVIGVRTVSDAVKILEEQKDVSIIWLDHYLLGEETGLDFVAKIKKHEKWKNIPVFVVSNTAGPEKRQIYIKLGITKYYVKSDYHLDDIIEDLREAIKQPE